MSSLNGLEVMRARRGLCPECGHWPADHGPLDVDDDIDACNLTRAKVLALIKTTLKDA